MIRALLIAVALAALSVATWAQTPSPPQSNAAAFTGQLAAMLATTITERDAIHEQLAACQAAKVADAKPAQSTSEQKP